VTKAFPDRNILAFAVCRATLRDWKASRLHAPTAMEVCVTNSTLPLSKSIPKPCYKQYTGIVKIDTEMTCYRQYTGVLKIDTEMKCFKQYRGVLKIDTEIASVLYKGVHSSRDRHCCIYRYKYISGRDQVEVSQARSKSTTANNLCFRYSGGRSSSNASPEKQYKTPSRRAESSPTSRPGGGSNARSS
jgi:hypothetical protein